MSFVIVNSKLISCSLSSSSSGSHPPYHSYEALITPVLNLRAAVDLALKLTLYLCPFCSEIFCCFNWTFQSCVPAFLMLQAIEPSAVFTEASAPPWFAIKVQLSIPFEKSEFFKRFPASLFSVSVTFLTGFITNFPSFT